MFPGRAVIRGNLLGSVPGRRDPAAGPCGADALRAQGLGEEEPAGHRLVSREDHTGNQSVLKILQKYIFVRNVKIFIIFLYKLLLFNFSKHTNILTG